MEFEYKGGSYFGESTEGIPDGYGVLLLENGAQMGEWKNGELTAGCEYIGSTLYVGRYLNGVHHGTGLYASEDGKIIKKTDLRDYGYLNRDLTVEELFAEPAKDVACEMKILNCGIYKGETKDGAPHGYGRLVFDFDDPECRACYFGEFKNGIPHGKGLLQYKPYPRNECMSYEGDFCDGTFHGEGILYVKDGHCKSHWIDGRLEGDGNECVIAYNSWSGHFEDGWFISGKFYNRVFKISHDGEIDRMLRPSRYKCEKFDAEFWKSIL